MQNGVREGRKGHRTEDVTLEPEGAHPRGAGLRAGREHSAVLETGAAQRLVTVLPLEKQQDGPRRRAPQASAASWPGVSGIKPRPPPPPPR